MVSIMSQAFLGKYLPDTELQCLESLLGVECYLSGCYLEYQSL